MKDIAYYNGKIGRIDEVQAPITDRGFYFGDGVYDAAMVNNKKIFELEDHLDRFYNSLKLLRIEPPMQRDELTKTLNELVSQLDSDAPHMLYWQSTRAVAHRMHAFPKGGKASLMAFSEPCGLDRQDHPYKLISVEDTRFLHCNIKTLNLIPNCMAMQQAVEAGCDEVVFHRGDRVTECSHSNVHILKNGTLYTAPCDELILPGITRAHILNICKANGIPVVEEPFTLEDMMNADEVFFSSSSALTCRIGEIDGRKVGLKDEKTFSVIRDGYQKEIRREAGLA